MKLIELSEVEILIMKSIWKLRDGITVYEIIDYLDQVYDRKYTRSTVKTYITKLKKKGFVDTQVKGNYSYITAKITEEMYREEQMELMKDFWHDGSVKELVQTLTHTISKEEKEELKDLIDDLDDLKNIYLCHQYDTAEWFGGKYFVYVLSQDKAATREKRTDQYVHYCFKRSSFIISDANCNCIDLFHLLCI